jgi:hypothetical protein
MSVIMTLRVHGDPKELERRAAANPDAIRAISDRAKAHGVIAHRFYGSEDGEIMVIDEWPDPESFQSFFAEARSEIEPLMREVGATSEPEVTFWHKLESHDEVGWDAEPPDPSARAAARACTPSLRTGISRDRHARPTYRFWPRKRASARRRRSRLPLVRGGRVGRGC